MGNVHRAWLAAALVGIAAAAGAGPELPSPRIPAAEGARAKPKPPKLILRKKVEAIDPVEHGAARVDHEAAVVEADGPELTATLTAQAFAHAYIGKHAEGVASVRLIQPFDVVPAEGESWGRVEMDLKVKLDGYLRTEPGGRACLRVASAAIVPACGGPAYGLSLPGACASGCRSARWNREAALPPVVLPDGRYLLDVRLVLEADVDGLAHGHAEAIFGPERPEATWDTNAIPPADLDRDGFGFTVTMTAKAP